MTGSASTPKPASWPPAECPGAFLDLPAELCDPRAAAIAVLPVPYDGTSTWRKGADAGPRALIDASAAVEWYDLETETEPCRQGITTWAPLVDAGSPEAMSEQVAGAVGEILERKQLPVVLGGEHSVTIGAVRAVADRFPGVSVLQIDAHADTRETYEGSTHNHACVMARARECCPCVQVGIRSLDASEVEGLDRDRVFFANEIVGADHAWMDRVVERLDDPVYVTIDLDAFDPSLLPATGTPEPGGLSWSEVTGLLERVAGRRRVVGFDVVELCPAPGHHASDFIAAKLAYRMMAMVLARR